MFDFFLLRMLMHHNVSVLCKWTWRSSTKGKPEQNCHAQQRTAHTQDHYYQSLVSKSLKNLWASTIHHGFLNLSHFLYIYIYTDYIIPGELYFLKHLQPFVGFILYLRSPRKPHPPTTALSGPTGTPSEQVWCKWCPLFLFPTTFEPEFGLEVNLHCTAGLFFERTSGAFHVIWWLWFSQNHLNWRWKILGDSNTEKLSWRWKIIGWCVCVWWD